MRTLLLTIAAVIGVLSLRAGETWTYSDCVEHARLHNISLQKLRLAEESADIDLDLAKGNWQPSLDFSTAHGFINTPWGEGNKNSYTSNYGLNASWTVWNGGERENTIRKNKLATKISQLATDDEMRTIETEILQVYLNILYARESIGICREAARLSEAQAQRSRQMMEAGRVSKVDYAQLAAQAQQDRYNLVNAEATYESRRLELKKLLELGLEQEIELSDIPLSEEDVLAALPEMTDTYRLAVINDLKLRSLELESESSDLDVNIAQAGRMPTIALTGSVSTGYNAPGPSFATSLKRAFGENIGVTVSVPILDKQRTSAAVAKARVNKMNAQLDIDQRNTELAQLVENQYIDTRSAQSRYTAAREQLQSARLSNDLTNAQFELGLVNPVELMTAHNNLTEAQFTLLQAKYLAILGQKMIEYYRESKITLN